MEFLAVLMSAIGTIGFIAAVGCFWSGDAGAGAAFLGVIFSAIPLAGARLLNRDAFRLGIFLPVGLIAVGLIWAGVETAIKQTGRLASQHAGNAAPKVAASDTGATKPQPSESVSFTARIANFFGQSAAEPKSSNGRPSPHVNASDAVQSWARFLDAAKARVAGVDAEWKKEHPEGSIYVDFRSQDVKKSDSLIHPVVGEVVLSYRLDYGPNGMRDFEIKNLETSLAVFAALGRKYFEMGNRVKEKELLKQVEETEELLKRARQKSTRLAATYAATLKFGWSETDGAWKFLEGTDKTEACSIKENSVGQTVNLTALTGTLKSLFSQ